MATASTEYVGDLRTACSHESSGTEIFTDAPVDNKGKGSSFSPTDLFVTSYAACMTTIMGIYCQEHNIVLNHCTSKVKKVMYTEPRRVGEIHIEIDLSGNNFERATLNKIIRAAKSCPMAFSIHPDIKVEINYITDEI